MKFTPPSKSLTLQDYLFIAAVILIFVVLSAALIAFNLNLPGGGEFLTHWAGARAYIYEHISPYGGEVPARVQSLVYGRAALPGEEPRILDTPFHLLLFYFPFALFENPQLARAVFTWTLQLALLPLAWMSIRLTDWDAPLIFTALFAALTVFNFYSIQALLEASPIILLGALYAGILLSLRENADELAGALLAASIYYWEAGAPFLFLVALWAYRQKRSGVLYGFFMLAAVLLLVSFLIYANWLVPFLRASVNNFRAPYGESLRAALTALFPAAANWLTWVVMLALFAALTYEWSIARDSDFRRFYWAACLSLAAAPLLGFRTEMENLAVLILPLALIFSVIYDRWRRAAHLLTLLLALFVFLIPWALASLSNLRPALFLFLPVFTLIGLYWVRWWALRPPRTWADLARAAR
ncbi:MAG: hypothetical protein Fur002_01430 [Anaerolineales bacterium]